MRRWRHWAYPFPADESVGLLWEVFDRVPVAFAAALDWTLTDNFVVAVVDVKTAIYLRLAFNGGRLEDAGGLPILEEHEVLISIDERAECEAMLRENCHAEGQWFSLIVVHAQTQAARLAFEAAYRAVIANTIVVV